MNREGGGKRGVRKRACLDFTAKMIWTMRQAIEKIMPGHAMAVIHPARRLAPERQASVR